MFVCFYNIEKGQTTSSDFVIANSYASTISIQRSKSGSTPFDKQTVPKKKNTYTHKLNACKQKLKAKFSSQTHLLLARGASHARLRCAQRAEAPRKSQEKLVKMHSKSSTLVRFRSRTWPIATRTDARLWDVDDVDAVLGDVDVVAVDSPTHVVVVDSPTTVTSSLLSRQAVLRSATLTTGASSARRRAERSWPLPPLLLLLSTSIKSSDCPNRSKIIFKNDKCFSSNVKCLKISRTWRLEKNFSIASNALNNNQQQHKKMK